MSQRSRPVAYPVIRTLLTYLPFNKRKELAARSESLRKVEKSIPYLLNYVELAEDWAANCCRFWIDGTVFRFDYTVKRKDFVRVVTARKSTLDLPNRVISRCIEYYLNRPNVQIKQLTINKSCWPSRRFFPKNVSSLKLIIAEGTEKPLKRFENMRFEQVIVNNTYNTSKIFSFPMVYKAKYLSINSVEMQNKELLEMPLLSNVTIHEKKVLNSNFIEFCEKLATCEKLRIGLIYIGTSHEYNFNMKQLLTDLKRQTNSRKATWNGRKCVKIDIKNEKELVVSWNKTGSLFQPKHNMSIHVLKKGSSTERSSGIIQNLVNVYSRLKPN